jgi:hypothetical protein
MLVCPQRLPEGGPLLDVLDARLEAGLGEAERLGGDHDAGRVEEVHQLAEAVPLFPDQVGLRNADVLEGDLRRVARADAHFSVDLVPGDPLRIRGDDDQTETVPLVMNILFPLIT